MFRHLTLIEHGLYRYKQRVNISQISKDVVGLKFIVIREHTFGGQYLVLEH